MVSSARSLLATCPPRVVAAAMVLSSVFPKVVWAQEARAIEPAQQTQIVVSEPAPRPSHRRLVATLIGVGAGVGLGLLAGVKGLPEASCKDGKVWGVASAFGAAGALFGNTIGGRGSSGRFDVAMKGPRGPNQPLDAETVRLMAARYRFLTQAD